MCSHLHESAITYLLFCYFTAGLTVEQKVRAWVVSCGTVLMLIAERSNLDAHIPTININLRHQLFAHNFNINIFLWTKHKPSTTSWTSSKNHPIPSLLLLLESSVFVDICYLCYVWSASRKHLEILSKDFLKIKLNKLLNNKDREELRKIPISQDRKKLYLLKKRPKYKREYKFTKKRSEHDIHGNF